MYICGPHELHLHSARLQPSGRLLFEIRCKITKRKRHFAALYEKK